MLNETKLTLPKPKYDYIKNEEEARSAMSVLDRHDVIGMDTECTGLDPHTSKVSLVQLATPSKAYVFDVRHDTPYSSLHLDVLKPLLVGKQLKILQNATYDMQMIKANYGYYIENIYDTMLVEQLLNLGVSFKSSLDYLTKKYLGITMDKQPRDTFAKYEQKFKDYQLEYAANDGVILHEIRNCQLPQITEQGFQEVCRLEFEFTKALSEMEINGMLLDVNKWRAIISEAESDMNEAERKVSELLAPSEDQTTLFGVSAINIGSPQQLLAALKKHGLPVESTNNNELSKYKGMPVVDAILEYRKYYKLVSTYGEPLIRQINSVTGRLHTQFKQMVATGRMSSSNPNLQNIPKKQMYRSCFVAPEGYRLITADMSGAELRILGNLSRDPIFIESYANGIDLHTRTASETFGVPMNKVLHSQRDAAKALNFGLCLSGNTHLHTDLGTTYLSEAVVGSEVAHDVGNDNIIDKKYMGKKEVFELETQYGYSLEATPDHMFKVIDSSGNYVDKELRHIDLEKDYVCLKYGANLFADSDYKFDYFNVDKVTNYKDFDLPTNMTEDYAAFLGLFVSEGSVSKVKGRNKYSHLQFGFSCNNEEFIEKADLLFERLFSSRLTRGQYEDVVRYSFSSVLFGEWLSHVCGIRGVGKVNNIGVPDCIKKSTKKIQSIFLSWLFEGDGSLKVNGDGSSITYSSRSHNLVKDIQIMLLNFGILSSIRFEPRRDYPENKYWELRVVSNSSRKKFMSDIGFLTDLKNSRFSDVGKDRQSAYFLPHQSKRLNNILLNRSKEQLGSRRLYDLIYNAKNYTRGLGNIYLEELSVCDEFIEFIHQNNILPLPIKSVKSKGFKDVYDISVNNHQYFLANGFVVHNCYGLSKFGLARRLKISEKEAEKIINNYFDRYKGIKRYLDKAAAEAVRKRYSRTVSGRKRFYRLPPYTDPDFKRAKAGIERQAKNAGIQGANADTIKQSMIYLVNRLEEGGYDAKLISTVHDEVIVEVREDQVYEVADVTVGALKDGFGRYFDLIPMESDALIGPCWLKDKCEREISKDKECGCAEMVSVPTDDKFGSKVVCKSCGGEV